MGNRFRNLEYLPWVQFVLEIPIMPSLTSVAVGESEDTVLEGVMVAVAVTVIVGFPSHFSIQAFH